jgi:hypothetical protein
MSRHLPVNTAPAALVIHQQIRDESEACRPLMRARRMDRADDRNNDEPSEGYGTLPLAVVVGWYFPAKRVSEAPWLGEVSVRLFAGSDDNRQRVLRVRLAVEMKLILPARELYRIRSVGVGIRREDIRANDLAGAQRVDRRRLPQVHIRTRPVAKRQLAGHRSRSRARRAGDNAGAQEGDRQRDRRTLSAPLEN